MTQGMNSARFREWRKAYGLKQKDAADKLGLKKRVIQYYEKGDRDGKAVEIPKSVELACLALALGHEGYDGGPVPKARALERVDTTGDDMAGDGASDD
ncbi:helix-turn-helix domain-containing protein [Aureimonas mangrovi]|uniref:helix-turn-helix domain-containing protein n=1 Tax=Aureimonas mangrovi TaxID=2758041 RepID=UPI001FEB5850|nr:helix-turn-helix transcriptional regulator [Aureimonas mangrovi]